MLSNVTVSSLPKLKKGVVLERLRYNLLTVRKNVLENNVNQTEYPQLTNLIFNRVNGEFRGMSDQAMEILLYCNGYRSIAKIASELGKKYDASAAKIQADCLSILKSFVEDKYLVV
jgi:hypothetical protein